MLAVVKVLVLSVVLFGTAVVVDAGCGSSATAYLTPSKIKADVDYLYIDAPYSVSIVQGYELATIWKGTDGGQIQNEMVVGNAANMTLVDLSLPGSAASKADRIGEGLLVRILALVVGFGALKYFRTGFAPILVVIFSLSMAHLISTSSMASSPCSGATITIQIPESTIHYVCVNGGPCKCGPGFTDCIDDTPSPSSAPVSVITTRRSVGDPINSDDPYYPVLIDHQVTPPADLLGPILMPYPTNSWHTNMWLNKGEMPIITLPYLVQTRNTGVQICYAPRSFTTTLGITVFLKNLEISVSEQIQQRKVLDWDLMSVTMIWSNSPPSTYDPSTINSDVPANSMVAPIVQGSPYMTTKWNGLTPVISSIHAIISINGGSDASVTGTKFKMIFNNGQTWILYASNSITFNKADGTLTASAPYTGVLRAVCLTDASFENTLDQYKSSVVIATKVGWTANGDDAVLQFDYVTDDDSAPLMLTLPHHRDMMSGVTYVVPDSYLTMKGSMSGVVGKSWQLNEQLTKITWNAARAIPAQYEDAIRTALQADQTLAQIAGDTYGSGKVLSAIARLALIADELGETTIATSIRSRLKNYLENWFTGKNTDKFVYDHTWGGTVSSLGILDKGADYGMGYYNDQHFHFGYFVYAAAVVAKADSTWATTWTAAIDDLVRTFANPVQDNHYPVTRMKDWYAGHSWASGLFEFADGKNQESSSESINGYYGMYLWGLATNRPNLRDLGRVMLAQEIRTTKKYWHMDDKSNEIYDQVFADNGCVGIVWGTKVDFATWFGLNIEFIIGIQMLPFTPISEEYMNIEWVNTVYPSISTALNRADPVLLDGWRGFIYMSQAVIDRSTAWTNINTMTNWDNGNTKTNALYWVATRAN